MDSLLVKAGSGLLTLGHPTSGGVPKSFAEETIVLPYNDPQAFVECFEAFPDKIAAVIIEPIAGNMNLVKPNKDFVKLLRDTCLRAACETPAPPTLPTQVRTRREGHRTSLT